AAVVVPPVDTAEADDAVEGGVLRSRSDVGVPHPCLLLPAVRPGSREPISTSASPPGVPRTGAEESPWPDSWGAGTLLAKLPPADPRRVGSNRRGPPPRLVNPARR